MIGMETTRNLFNYIFSKTTATETQVSLHSEHSYLTRFANSIVHQNVMEKNTRLIIKSIVGKRIGEAATNSIKRSNVLRTLEQSIDIAKHKKEDPDYHGLPKPRIYRKATTYFRATQYLSHRKKVNIIHSITEASKPFTCFGAFTTGISEIAIGNSNGLFAYNTGTDAIMRLTMKGDNGSSSGQLSHRDICRMDFNALQNDVFRKTKLSQNPRTDKPGKYTVLLTPEAVSDILIFLGYLGFNSLLYSEGRSCLKGKIGRKIFHRKFTLVDNPFDKRGFSFPFDFEGVPKKKLTLVDNGVVKTLVYDRTTAYKMGKRSTGHCIETGMGPIPYHLVIKKGTETVASMIAGIKSGIAINTFHYVNVVEPRRLVLTGMTRNGTYLIENGHIAYALKNLRFNQSILEAFNNILSISTEMRFVEGGNTYGARFPWGSVLPYITIAGFNFSGTTEF
ncbi:MAG: TldD/PmbA family protein [Candidatus Cloacimonadota bacterium]|nr:MAG: TldD/PmbA family protein [Candidatus Cloacimonadota bacterium]